MLITDDLGNASLKFGIGSIINIANFINDIAVIVAYSYPHINFLNRSFKKSP